MPPPKEKTIQDQILLALGTYPGMAIWRSAVGNGWVRTKGGPRSIRFGGMPGQADILGCYYGRFLAIEVKRPVRWSKQSDEQIDWQGAIEAAGGTYILARSVDDALEGVARMFTPQQVLHLKRADAIPVALPVGAGAGNSVMGPVLSTGPSRPKKPTPTGEI